MNRLQGIDERTPLFVTLNPTVTLKNNILKILFFMSIHSTITRLLKRNGNYGSFKVFITLGIVEAILAMAFTRMPCNQGLLQPKPLVVYVVLGLLKMNRGEFI